MCQELHGPLLEYMESKQVSRNRGRSSNRQHDLGVVNISKRKLLHSSPWQCLLVWSLAAEITSVGQNFAIETQTVKRAIFFWVLLK